MNQGVVVLGAAGHIGSTVCKRLSEMNAKVLGFNRSDYDVAMRNTQLPRTFAFGALIYCVGRRPPGGFLETVKRQLSKYRFTDLEREIDIHIRGPLYVFQSFLSAAQNNGHFIFMSSAATHILQMPRENRPPIHIYHHLATIAAEDALIEGMRMDPEVIARGIKIHKVAPPAIGDSPFHQTEGASKPPMTVTTTEVVDAIIGCLSTTTHTDVLMVPTR